MRGFTRLCFITTATTYLLIFVGGLVRVSGAGLGCPDWPKCFGRWIPPVSAQQLPPDMDPSQFNFTLAWIEYSNRLLGMTVGLLILATAVLAIKYYRKSPRILYPAWAAALLTAFQGWQGGEVVTSQLKPVIVSAHMGIALVIVSLMIYVTREAYYAEIGAVSTKSVPAGRSRVWIGVLWLVTIIQIVIGTQVRSSLEIADAANPLLTSAELIEKVKSINIVHALVGLAAAALAWKVLPGILRRVGELLPILRQAGFGAMMLVAIQVLLGLAMMLLGINPMIQVFHLWVASLLVGLLLLGYAELTSAKD
jgi:cytochrome c oxidase assembly protein subunit 15